MKTLKADEWWDLRNVLASGYRIALVVGGRGVGKTFNVKKSILPDLFFNGVSMIYLRRLGVEIDDLEKGNFITKELLQVTFGDRFANYNEDKTKNLVKFTIDDEIHELKFYGHHLYFDGRIIVYFTALSRAGRVKSNDYPDTKYIVYDEVIIDKKIMPNARYIRNEFTVLLNFIETVKRKRKDFYLFMLSNVGENFNPIFAGLSYYLTYEDIEKGFIERDTYCIELVPNKEEKLDMSDPFTRLGASNRDYMLSKTNAFENIRTPHFNKTNLTPQFVIKYERQYLGIAEKRVPAGVDLYYKVYEHKDDVPDDVMIYNPDFDTLLDDEEFLTDTFLKKRMSSYFELFQKNMVYHENPTSFLAWSRMVYDLKR